MLACVSLTAASRCLLFNGNGATCVLCIAADQLCAPARCDGRLPVHNRGLDAVERRREADFREQAQRIACHQGYAADAHVNCHSVGSLGPVLERYGRRGYRIAHLEAPLYLGKLHLAARQFRLGAVGSTSLDDKVAEFFSPHAAGKRFLFVAVFDRRRSADAP